MIHGLSFLSTQTTDETNLHSFRVANYAYEFGLFLTLEEAICHELFQGGLLHDIGKHAVPKDILYKTTPVTETELQLIKDHVKLAKTQVDFSLLSINVQDMILQHHERIDGYGYPYQLSADEINPLAQIIALCDVYDALTSKRSYHEARSPQETLDWIASRSGSHFQPKLTQQFIRFIQQKLGLN